MHLGLIYKEGIEQNPSYRNENSYMKWYVKQEEIGFFLLILKTKERVMNFEIPPCDVLTKKFVIKPTEGVKRQQRIQRETAAVEIRFKMGAHCP